MNNNLLDELISLDSEKCFGGSIVDGGNITLKLYLSQDDMDKDLEGKKKKDISHLNLKDDEDLKTFGEYLDKNDNGYLILNKNMESNFGKTMRIIKKSLQKIMLSKEDVNFVMVIDLEEFIKQNTSVQCPMYGTMNKKCMYNFNIPAISYIASSIEIHDGIFIKTREHEIPLAEEVLEFFINRRKSLKMKDKFILDKPTTTEEKKTYGTIIK